MAHGRDKYRSRRNRAEVARVLLEDWDPIGVKGLPGWRDDEYDAYVGTVYVMLMETQASSEEIASRLQDFATGRMGLPAAPHLVERCRSTAEVLIALRPSFESADPRDPTE